jgi:hypothetical protein
MEAMRYGSNAGGVDGFGTIAPRSSEDYGGLAEVSDTASVGKREAYAMLDLVEKGFEFWSQQGHHRGYGRGDMGR